MLGVPRLGRDDRGQQLQTLRSRGQEAGPTVVQVAEVPSVEEEVSPEEVSEPPPAWPEGQGGVEVQATGPVGLSSQEVPCGTGSNGAPTVKPSNAAGLPSNKPSVGGTFTLGTQAVHAESSDAGGTPQVEPEGRGGT